MVTPYETYGMRKVQYFSSAHDFFSCHNQRSSCALTRARYTDVAPDTVLGFDLARAHASRNGGGEHAHSIERALSYPTT